MEKGLFKLEVSKKYYFTPVSDDGLANQSMVSTEPEYVKKINFKDKVTYGDTLRLNYFKNTANSKYAKDMLIL